MDLELSDEQRWLSESVEALLARHGSDQQEVWRNLVDFGALTVGGDEGLGAIELCLIARGLGSHLVAVPYIGSAAVRFATDLADGDDSASLALLEPASGWGLRAPRRPSSRSRSAGARSRSSTPERSISWRSWRRGATASRSRSSPRGPTASWPPSSRRSTRRRRCTASPSTRSRSIARPVAGPEALPRLVTIAALLAAADAVGAAGRMLQDACAYAAERRQFGRPIGSFQALRHLLADMYVRHASSWSSVLYAAAALDEDAADAQRTAAVAKAYVSRAAREVAHGAIQVFGGVAITDEHPAHRYLRRIVLREQQYGDAAHHERELGRALARAAVVEPVAG